MTDILRYRMVRAPKELSAQPIRTLPYPRQDKPKDDEDGGKKTLWMVPDDSRFADPDRLSGGDSRPKPGSKAASKVVKKAAKKAASKTAVNVPSAPAPAAQSAGIGLQQARDFLNSATAINPDDVHTNDLFLSQLIAFSRALDNVEATLDSAAAQALLNDWAKKIGAAGAANSAFAIASDKRWLVLRVRVGDSLIAQMLVRGAPLHVRFLNRLMLAIGVIEVLAELKPLETLSAQQIAFLYLYRIVLLPAFIMPMPAVVAKKAALKGEGAFFARAPAFSDHVVVREEWSCYVPGEIAHIENVLRGEKKEREHVRKEETEVTEITDITAVKVDERDQQTTDRNSMQEEASSQTKLEVGVEAQVDVAAQYGPTSIAAHFGASLNYSNEEARRKSNQQSREIVTRTVERLESKVRQARSTRTLRQIKETNAHLIDNSVSPSGNVVGVYRWVDKINRLQVFRYRHRFVLEFQIPEPAAFVRWLGTNKPPAKVNVEPPPAFTNSANQPLTPAHITPTTYMALVAKFKASGVMSPPDQFITMTAAKDFNSNATAPADRNNPVGVPPMVTGTIELAVPKEYEAISAAVSLGAAPALFKWRDQEEAAGDKYAAEVLGYHVVTAAVTIGGAVLKLATNPATTVRATSGSNGVAYNSAWTTVTGSVAGLPAAGMGYGTLTAGVTVGGTYRCSLSIRVECRLQPNVMEQWRLDTFDRLRAAYAAAESAYKEALNAAEVRAGITIDERSPLRNAQTVREEMKRQVVEMLIGANFDGVECLNQPVDAVKGPVTKLDTAAAAAPFVQFLEQAFEWDNMTYVMYPYFWTDRSRWRDLQPLDSADPSFLQFLRSGSARVVLPARPGFEWAALYFSIFGEPWFGGPPPIPGDPLYVSVAQEIQDQLGAPDDGEPGDMWEVKLPTALVWIDPDSNLPKCNTARKLVGTPLIDLCGDSCPPPLVPAPAPEPAPGPTP